MKHTFSSRGFSLVELLVVITILAIISTVAYTSFSGATDKAKNSKRIESLTAIESALQLFRQANQYLPMPATYNATTNVWGYNPAINSVTKSTILTTTNGDAITAVTGVGGGRVMGIGTASAEQIGAKGVMDPSVLPKSSLSQDLLDPGLKDIKVGSDKVFSDFGIGRFIYSVYAKGAAPAAWNLDGK